MGSPKSQKPTNLKSSVLKSSDQFREVLKDVAKINQTTVSDYIHDIVKISILQQSIPCPFVELALSSHAQDIPDARIYKPCAGWACMKCKHKEECIIGDDEDCLFEMADDHREYLKARGYDVVTTYETITIKIPVTRVTPIKD